MLSNCYAPSTWPPSCGGPNSSWRDSKSPPQDWLVQSHLQRGKGFALCSPKPGGPGAGNGGSVMKEGVSLRITDFSAPAALLPPFRRSGLSAPREAPHLLPRSHQHGVSTGRSPLLPSCFLIGNIWTQSHHFFFLTNLLDCTWS